MSHTHPSGARRLSPRRGALRLAAAAALGTALLAGGAATAQAAPAPVTPAAAGALAPAALPYGPYTCKAGFVWREAGQNDLVCVTPASRTQVRGETAAGPSHRAGSGPYGPDTCKSGYVWREAQPSDRVCVVPAARTRAKDENRNGVLNLADPAGVPAGRVSITNSRDQLSCYMYGSGRATPGAEQWFWSVGVRGYGTIRAGVARADGAGVVPWTTLRNVYRNWAGPVGVPVVVADTATGIVTRAGTTNSYGDC